MSEILKSKKTTQESACEKRSYSPSDQLPDITQTKSTILSLMHMQSEHDLISASACEDRLYKTTPLTEVTDYADRHFSGEAADKILIYNPDAIGYWIYRKYSKIFAPVLEKTDVSLKLATVYPPVTPVCFGSMYTGMVPARHGIMKYEKFVLKVPTLFDVLAKSDKKTAIVSTKGDSISILFLDRGIDYFIRDTISECNAIAEELIRSRKYDVIVLYNGNYDYWMHRNSPTGPIAVSQLKKNADTFCRLHDLISSYWTDTNNALVFAPDHGCHRWLGLLGNHGDMIERDMEIPHFYSFIPKKSDR